MRHARHIGSVFVIGAALAGATPAFAAETASGSFAVRLVVPERCEINSSPLLVSEGNGFQTGSVFESCNVQEGFQVVANYRQLAANEHVLFSYAGTTRQLGAHGWTQVANRTGAKFGTRPISVQHSGLTEPLAINLTITHF
ncbi:hypothetical protein [Sphingomonas cavernae]|uniref:Spore coat protein U domain-containing protein n=1 Tax=Sphingomonas cavernae TaxID=2320861 RepID=A0A418WQ84_9SPHN|nr:hypothetical protein [Sphingomonas cavernae]RJF93371.1 hypothetical protein D3876_03245 [Sphingomonas cavernae]